jgi:hypothetical protein
MHDAFIGHSRRNRAFAARLEAALENYRPPPELRTPGRRLSVFRDEGDFSGTQYETSIERHLVKMPIATDYRGWDPRAAKIDRGPFEQE